MWNANTENNSTVGIKTQFLIACRLLLCIPHVFILLGNSFSFRSVNSRVPGRYLFNKSFQATCKIQQKITQEPFYCNYIHIRKCNMYVRESILLALQINPDGSKKCVEIKIKQKKIVDA